MNRKIKKHLLITLAILLALPLSGLLIMRYIIMPSEGYPTWQVVRNIILRDGEIRVTLPTGVTPVSAHCQYAPQSSTTIQGNQVIAKVGYSWCQLHITATTPQGETLHYLFNPQKLNNWNRIHYLPQHPADPHSPFLKFENGLQKDPHDAHLTEILSTK